MAVFLLGILSILIVLIILPLLFLVPRLLGSSGVVKTTFSQKWLKVAVGVGVILILYYFWGNTVVSWFGSVTEELDARTVFSSIPWWGWLLVVVGIGMLLGRKSDPFDAVLAIGMVAIALLVAGFVFLVIADVAGWDDKFVEMSNPRLPAVCTTKAQKEQQDSLIRHGPGAYIDEVGRDIAICRNQKGPVHFLTRNGAPIEWSIPDHFKRDYGYLMPGDTDEMRLAQFIGISPGNIREAWVVWPKLQNKDGNKAPFYAQNLDYVIVHVKLAP